VCLKESKRESGDEIEFRVELGLHGIGRVSGLWVINCQKVEFVSLCHAYYNA